MELVVGEDELDVTMRIVLVDEADDVLFVPDNEDESVLSIGNVELDVTGVDDDVETSVADTLEDPD